MHDGSESILDRQCVCLLNEERVVYWLERSSGQRVNIRRSQTIDPLQQRRGAASGTSEGQ